MLELGGNKLGEEGWSSGEKGNGRGGGGEQEFKKAGRAWKRIRTDGLLAMGPAKFAKRPRENRDDYTARCDAMRERNERKEGRGGRKDGRKREKIFHKA